MQQCLTDYIFYVQFFLTECYFAEVCERGQLIPSCSMQRKPDDSARIKKMSPYRILKISLHWGNLKYVKSDFLTCFLKERKGDFTRQYKL